MPPRTQPKIYQVLIKTHKLTILTTVAPTISVAALKAEVLSALASDVNTSSVDPDAPIPSVTTVQDFELCKAVKDKARGRLTGEYMLLDEPKLSLRDAGVANWEALFVQFRDAESGDLQPVVFTPFEDDEDGVTPQFGSTSAPAPAPSAAAPAESSTSRGKRKARPD
ncbi:hypothetical protein MVEN_01194000 [Mycena venus]|uniref:Uncharacterized protein n=1 Tax=Mycena venus TaxID=2733690 RepID=A0A8H7CYP6_9AGAR|nr:hypothetical protein MVEN_01194000 [Mycena venus]